MKTVVHRIENDEAYIRNIVISRNCLLTYAVVCMSFLPLCISHILPMKWIY